MRHLLREPLVHFVLLGAVLFGAYAPVERGRVAVEPSRGIRDLHKVEGELKRKL